MIIRSIYGVQDVFLQEWFYQINFYLLLQIFHKEPFFYGEDNEDMLADNKIWLMDAEATNTVLLYDIRDLYKRLDAKNEDIQILNTLLKEQ